MTDVSTRFHTLVDDFGRMTGLRIGRTVNFNDWVIFLEGGAVEANISYLPTSDQVVTSAFVAPFRPSADAEGRARALLELNWQWKGSSGFTVAVDDGLSVLMVADRRAARRFTSAEALGVYLARLAKFVHELRTDLAEFEVLSECLAEETFDDEEEEKEI